MTSEPCAYSCGLLSLLSVLTHVWSHVQARRDEEYAAMRAEREKERKARQAELAGEPFNKEVNLLTNHMQSKAVSSLIVFLCHTVYLLAQNLISLQPCALMLCTATCPDTHC